MIQKIVKAMKLFIPALLNNIHPTMLDEPRSKANIFTNKSADPNLMLLLMMLTTKIYDLLSTIIASCASRGQMCSIGRRSTTYQTFSHFLLPPSSLYLSGQQWPAFLTMMTGPLGCSPLPGLVV